MSRVHVPPSPRTGARVSALRRFEVVDSVDGYSVEADRVLDPCHVFDAFGACLDAGSPDFVADGVCCRQVPLWLTDEEFEEFASGLRSTVNAARGNGP